MSIDHRTIPTPTLVVHATPHARDVTLAQLEARLEEAVGLCEAIALDVQATHIARVRGVTPATFIGKGKVEELAIFIEEHAITLTVMDCALTPLQQRNLEKGLGCKVIDRTALILEIFGARARTAEGKLQVELASLTYQKSRLVRSWTHLERQRGGFGFMGGPGESQIEIDRRLIGERIDKIKAQLAKAVRTRALHRKRRKDAPYPVVALVGYTNAGKSTLFNMLTDADVMAKDMLFATLDPTLRALKLPSGKTVMLADTVGFIADLPTELIAAFRATLEEVLEADVLIHVRDATNPASEEQKRDVMSVLKSLFGKEGYQVPMIEVMNKIDALSDEAKRHGGIEGHFPLADDTLHSRVFVSAVSGENCDQLCEAIDAALMDSSHGNYIVYVPAHDGKTYAWLHANADVRHVESEENGDYKMKVALSTHQLNLLTAKSATIIVQPEG